MWDWLTPFVLQTTLIGKFDQLEKKLMFSSYAEEEEILSLVGVWMKNLVEKNDEQLYTRPEH